MRIMNITNNQQNRQNQQNFTAVKLGNAPQTYYKFSLIFPDVVVRNGILRQLKDVVTLGGKNLVLDFTNSKISGKITNPAFKLTTECEPVESYAGSFQYIKTKMADASEQFINQIKELAATIK